MLGCRAVEKRAQWRSSAAILAAPSGQIAVTVGLWGTCKRTDSKGAPMSRVAPGAKRSGDASGAQAGHRELPMLAIQIHFYGPDGPLTIPLPGLDRARAQSHLERLKSDVIEAQLHTDPRISIRPVDREQDVLVLDPSTIKQVILVDGSEPDDPTTDNIPAVASSGDEDGSAPEPSAANGGLNPDLQRRIDILLG